MTEYGTARDVDDDDEVAQTHRVKKPMPMVTPFARALSLLGAFTPQDRWLANGEFASRTGLPTATVSRIARSLVTLGYLRYHTQARRYELAAPVLALGYAAIANSPLQAAAREHMRAYARMNGLHVNLSMRDRLDLLVLDESAVADFLAPPSLRIGERTGIASSPMGWALLAALPELERYYLMENVERHHPREWSSLRRRVGEAVAQVYELGYCASVAQWSRSLGVIAAPVVAEGHAPLVIACTGAARHFTRPRVERELGPRLLAAVAAIQQASMDPVKTREGNE